MLGSLVNIHSSSTWAMEVGVQGQPQLHCEFGGGSGHKGACHQPSQALLNK